MTSRISIILRLVFIFITGFGAAYLITQTEFWLLGIWGVFFFFLGVFNLIRYIERSKKELFNFLEAIRQGDFSQGSISGRHDSKFNFNLLYRDIAQIFHQLNSKRASEHLLLQTVMEHISIAIVVFDENGNVEISNQATRDLFHIPHFRKVKRLFQDHPELEEKVSDHTVVNFAYKMTLNGNLTTLAIKKSYFNIKTSSFTIVSFQDIRQELEEKELESWQKLIRVLTHEIMNTAIPIATLASVISQMMIDENDKIHDIISDESKKDIFKGLKTIENRSQGLTQFVESYKHLTQLKPLKIKKINLNDLINDSVILLSATLEAQNIELNYKQNELYFQADGELFSQVILNLMLNAIQAFDGVENGQISVHSSTSNHRTQVVVEDNGCGIAPDVLDDIFVPFFTTKKEGSGIGLSLSRQIVRMHQGKITVKSMLGKGTKVTIEI
ncbi:MAG: ATP-binding protein [Reichenbachiella sp.]|uniref:sensor histidine kinase n=1 Tax=Reichenbachiella sp. TaxID=2184521 RepID=UPI0032670F7B